MHEQGKCPVENCGSPLDYGNSGVADEDYFYNWTCPNCGATGREWYVMKFVEHTVD